MEIEVSLDINVEDLFLEMESHIQSAIDEFAWDVVQGEVKAYVEEALERYSDEHFESVVNGYIDTITGAVIRFYTGHTDEAVKTIVGEYLKSVRIEPAFVDPYDRPALKGTDADSDG